MHLILWHNKGQKKNLLSSRGPLDASDLLKQRWLKLKCLFHTESFSEGNNFHVNEEPKLQWFMWILRPLQVKNLFCSNESMWVTHCSKISLLFPNLGKAMLSPQILGDSPWRDYRLLRRVNHHKRTLLQYINVTLHTGFPKSIELRSSSNPLQVQTEVTDFPLCLVALLPNNTPQQQLRFSHLSRSFPGVETAQLDTQWNTHSPVLPPPQAFWSFVHVFHHRKVMEGCKIPHTKHKEGTRWRNEPLMTSAPSPHQTALVEGTENLGIRK